MKRKYQQKWNLKCNKTSHWERRDCCKERNGESSTVSGHISEIYGKDQTDSGCVEQWRLTANLWADLMHSLCRLHFIGLWSGLVHREQWGESKTERLCVTVMLKCCVWEVKTIAGDLLIYPAREIFTARGPVFYFRTLTSSSVRYILRIVHITPRTPSPTEWLVTRTVTSEFYLKIEAFSKLLQGKIAFFLWPCVYCCPSSCLLRCFCAPRFGYHVASELSGRWYTNAAGIKDFITGAAL